MFMLPVYIDQHFRQLFQLPGCHRLSVYPAQTLSGSYLPYYDKCVTIQFYLHLPAFSLLGFSFYRKHKLYQCRLLPLTDHVLIRLGAESQIDGTNDDGLPRPRLSGQDIQPFSKIYFRFFD